jgi:hypothetical protein
VLVIGIDPGVTTGLSVWNAQSRALIVVTSYGIVRAMREVQALLPQTPLVIFEDARKRTWFGNRDENQQKYGSGVREGAGSVKRDSSIWEEFLTDCGVPFKSKTPGTKRNAPYFERLTGWQGQTNQHARDAALIVYGLNMPMCSGIVSAWVSDAERRCGPKTGRSSRSRPTAATTQPSPSSTLNGGS